MTVALDAVIIEVLADSSRFEKSLNADTKSAFSKLVNTAKRSMDRVEKELDRSSLGKGFRQQIKAVGKQFDIIDQKTAEVRQQMLLLERLEPFKNSTKRAKEFYRIVEQGVLVATKDLQVEFDKIHGHGAFTRLQKQIKKAEAAAKELRAEAALTRAAFDKMLKKDSFGNQTFAALDKQMDKIRMSAQQLQRLDSFGKLNKSGREFTALIRDKMKVQVEDLERTLKGLGLSNKEIKKITDELRGVKVEIKETGISAERAEEAMKAMAREMREGLDKAETKAKQVSDALSKMASEMRQDTKFITHAFKGVDDSMDDVRRKIQELGRLEGLGMVTDDARQLRTVLQSGVNEAIDELKVKLRGLGASDAAIDQIVRSLMQVKTQAKLAAREVNGLAAANRRAASFNPHTANTIARGSGLRAGLQRSRLLLTDLRFLAIAAGGALGVHLAGGAIKAAGEIQQFEAALGAWIEGMEGSAGVTQKVADQIEKIREVAKNTPFEFTELAEGTRRLAAFSDATGRAGSNVSETLDQAREDVLALSGVMSVLGQKSEAMNPLIKAIGDVGSRGKITGEEIKQFSNALPGFNVLEQISIGLTKMTEAGDESARGWTGMAGAAGDFTAAGVTAKTQIDALFNQMKVFPGAALALNAATLTLTGQMERFKETMKFAAQDGFRPLADALVPKTIDGFSILGQVAENLDDAVKALGISLSAIIPGALLGLSAAGGNLGLSLAGLFDEIGESGTEFGVAGLEAFARLIRALDEPMRALLDVGTALADGFVDLMVVVEPLVNVLADFLSVLAMLPSQVFAVATGIFALSKAFQAVFVMQGAAAITKMQALQSGLMILKTKGLAGLAAAMGPVGIALATLGTVMVAVGEQTRRVAEITEELGDVMRDFEDDGVRVSLQALKDYRKELVKFANAAPAKGLDFGQSLSLIADGLPFLETAFARTFEEARVARDILSQLDEATWQYQNTLGALQQTLAEQGFNLRIDQIEQFADALGVDVNDGFAVALNSMFELTNGWEDMQTRLNSFIDDFTAEQITDEIAKIGQEWSDAAGELDSYFKKQRAKTDPARGLLDNLTDLPGLQKELDDILNDGIPEADQLEEWRDAQNALVDLYEDAADNYANLIASRGSFADVLALYGEAEAAGFLPEGVFEKGRPIDISAEEWFELLFPGLETFINGLEQSTGIKVPVAYELVTEGENKATIEQVKQNALAAWREGEITLKLPEVEMDESKFGGGGKTSFGDLDLEPQGGDVGEGFSEGLRKKVQEIANKIPLWMESAATSLEQFWQISSPSRKTMVMGDQVAQGFIVGLRDGLNIGLVPQLTQVVDGLVPTIESTFARLGKAMTDGMVMGIESNADEVAAAARRMARDAETAIRNRLRIQSPSKVTEELGRFVGAGLSRGMDNTLASVASSATSMANAAVPPMRPSPGMTFSQSMGPGALASASNTQTSSSVDNRKTIVESPITVNGAGSDPAAVARQVSGAVMARAGL